ncbi:protein rolling stone-like [Clavelina lepadiformis]|uniref:protein rolling stone-like n=1 Tax=Clavelina lepadiformis TaxID=159417 RepID=UPI004042A467
MGNILKPEFKKKRFAFHDCSPQRFYKSQWCKSKWVFLAIKLVLFGYWFGWFLYAVILESINQSLHKYWLFLTNWGVVSILLYFITSTLVVIYGIAEDSEQPHETKMPNTVSGSIDRSTGLINSANTDNPNLRWFHEAVWILQSVSVNDAIIIDIAFWVGLKLVLFNGSSQSALSINKHAINIVIMIIDIFLNDIPVRLLHFYHSSLFMLAYSVFSLIVHASGYTSAIYPVLDWQNNVGMAIGLCLGITFIASPVVHALVFFTFYQLRLFIAQQTVLSTVVAPAVTLIEIDNPTFKKDEV